MSNKKQSNIGKNFLRLVEVAGFRNLYHLQDETGFPYTTSYELANGTTISPKLDTLRQLANIFKMDIGKLLIELTK